MLKWIENRLPRENHASISIEAGAGGPGETPPRRELEAAGLAISNVSRLVDKEVERRTFAFEVRAQWQFDATETSAMIEQLASHTGIREVEWKSES